MSDSPHFKIVDRDVYVCLICKDQPRVGKGRFSWERHEKNKKHQLNVARVRYYSINPASNPQPVSAMATTVEPESSAPSNADLTNQALATISGRLSDGPSPETILLDRSKRKRSEDSDSDGASNSESRSRRKSQIIEDLEDDNPWVLLNQSGSTETQAEAADGVQINITGNPPLPVASSLERMLRPEWVPDDRVYEATFPEMLHREILDFVEYVSPSKNDHTAREFLVGRFRSAVHQLWGHPSRKRSGNQWCDLLAFGSFRTKTYLPDGDMDLTVVTSRPRTEQALLGELRDMILKRGYCPKREIIALYNARVPIVKFTESRGGIDVDLSVNKQSGLESVEIIEAYLGDCRLGPVLRHLIFLIKQLLHQCGQDEPFTGGIGSYGLAIMIIYYLKTSDVATDPENEDLLDFVHILFLGWLEYFGVEFDYARFSIAISKDPAGEASLIPRNDQEFSLSIIDPQNPRNDVTKNNARQIRQIRNTLANAHSAIMSVYNECSAEEKPLPSSILCTVFSIPTKYKKIRMNIDRMAALLYVGSDPLTDMTLTHSAQRFVKLCRQSKEQLEAENPVARNSNNHYHERPRPHFSSHKSHDQSPLFHY